MLPPPLPIADTLSSMMNKMSTGECESLRPSGILVTLLVRAGGRGALAWEVLRVRGLVRQGRVGEFTDWVFWGGRSLG